ncbi:5857_t:CDS:2 [Paraglomus occultum]|uniref:5857_t:CDS:1 n=1 Tax=Paraglomus occultum TaxID=144539 RepID=A0A9N8Z061_9GLOM|nr:5857_t:CDS:2 [Paraglomus occultum]
MGNTLVKDKVEDNVDGGQLVPHGVYKTPQDWNEKIVRKLIIDRKLAPFYKGLSDYDETTEVTLTTHNHPKNGELKKATMGSGDHNAHAAKDIKRQSTLNATGLSKGKEPLPSKSIETQYKGAVECPICFLYYPRNINYSRCCLKPICTECFVQIKRPESGNLGANNSPAMCPFCVEPNFGVSYKPPPFSSGIINENSNTSNPFVLHSSSTSSLNQQDGKSRRKSISYKSSEVVTTDQIRPDWNNRAQAQRPNGRRPSASSSIMGNSRRISLRPPGSGSYATSPSPSSRRNNLPTGSEYPGYLRNVGADLEELMVMEAIRLSLLEQEERERRERDEREHGEPSPESSGESTSISEDSQPTTEDRAVAEFDDNNTDSELEANVTTTVMRIDGEQIEALSTTDTQTISNESDENKPIEVHHSSADPLCIDRVNDNDEDRIIIKNTSVASSSSATGSDSLLPFSTTGSNNTIIAPSCTAENIADATFRTAEGDDDNALPSFESPGDDVTPPLEGKQSEGEDSTMMCI